MVTKTVESEAMGLYGAVYDSLCMGNGNMSVYRDTGGRYWAGGSGLFRGQMSPTPPREVENNVSMDAYLPDGDLADMTRDEFVAMCMECYFGDDLGAEIVAWIAADVVPQIRGELSRIGVGARFTVAENGGLLLLGDEAETGEYPVAQAHQMLIALRAVPGREDGEYSGRPGGRAEDAVWAAVASLGDH